LPDNVRRLAQHSSELDHGKSYEILETAGNEKLRSENEDVRTCTGGAGRA
jgi:hypothetical protein